MAAINAYLNGSHNRRREEEIDEVVSALWRGSRMELWDAVFVQGNNNFLFVDFDGAYYHTDVAKDERKVLERGIARWPASYFVKARQGGCPPLDVAADNLIAPVLMAKEPIAMLLELAPYLIATIGSTGDWRRRARMT